MIPEPMSEAVGRASIEPADAVAPETQARWTVTYRVGETALGPGSLIRFTIPYGFTTPNFLWVTRSGYCHLTCSREGVGLRFVLPEPVEGPFHNFYMYRWGAHVFVEVFGGTLTDGDTASLIYGHNPFYPQKWARSAYFTQEFTWWVAVRPASAEGEELGLRPLRFILVADPPTLRVEPGPVERVGAIAPSLAARGETLRLRPYGEDVHRNRIVPLAGRGDLGLAPVSEAGGAVADSETLGPTVKVKVKDPGVFQAVVRVEDVAESKSSETKPGHSNPILISEQPPPYRLYWGDLHGHSIQSDGLGTVEEYYAYGRDLALLDFCSVADHAGHMGPGEWERARAAAEAADDPGRYVTFCGYELNDQAGEKCIYFRRDGHPMYRYPDDDNTLFELARAGEALIIPHQHGRGPWPYPKDVIRVTEMYSIWGAFEYPSNPRPCIGGGDYTGRTVLDMLLAGYRPGVIGGSDCHAGHPGHTDWLRACRAYWCGLAAVYAEELTREAVWEALLARRCYATTGPRIIVGLRSDGAWMGSEVPLEPGRERTFDIEVVGTEALKRVTLVKNGQPRFILPGDGQVLSTSVTDSEAADEPAFYYLRVEQEDGERAWSSAIWFVPAEQGRG